MGSSYLVFTCPGHLDCAQDVQLSHTFSWKSPKHFQVEVFKVKM